jgi:hypothetical protein
MNQRTSAKAFIFAGLFFAFPGWIANMPPLLWVGLGFAAVGLLLLLVAAFRT